MTAHVHAAPMALYAADAAETNEPWKRWEYSFRCEPERWFPVSTHPYWSEDKVYRRKPRTIRIGEFDVPEPMREAPPFGATYFMPDTIADGNVVEMQWYQSHRRILDNGFCHLTREAAELHAKALISLTERK